MPIFEERPLLVAFKSAASPVEHHEQRWRAYEMLVARANQEATEITTDRTWANALAAFDDLGISDRAAASRRIRRSDCLRRLSQGTASVCVCRGAGGPHRLITDTLMRFHCNQFGISNGATERDPAFAASAVYACTSRINHSCSPNVSMVTKETFCKQHRIACSVDQADGGVKMAVATRDIKQGERLTFSYQNEVTSPSMGVRELRRSPPRTSQLHVWMRALRRSGDGGGRGRKGRAAAATKPSELQTLGPCRSVSRRRRNEDQRRRCCQAPRAMPRMSLSQKSQQDEHEAPRRPRGQHAQGTAEHYARVGWPSADVDAPLALAGAAAVVTIAVAMAVRRARGAM